MIDLSPFRTHFPALNLTHKGQPLVFFDNPGGTQVPQQVIEHMSTYLRRSMANVHGAFVTSQRTDSIIEGAHSGLAALLGGAADEIVLGPNMTSLAFDLGRSLAREWGAGDEIIVTRLDHDANIAPWRMAAEDAGATLRWVDVNPDDCTLDMDDLKDKLSERTRFVAVGWASNAVGTITDVRRVADLAHEVGALCFVDAVQGVPHLPCDVHALGADFLACSVYKFYGPHIGVLWGRREQLQRLTAYKVRPAANELPWRWETGTQNHEGQAGIIGTLEYLGGIGISFMEQYLEQVGEVGGQRESLLVAMHAIADYERELGQYLLQRLGELPEITIYGITDAARAAERVPTVAFRHQAHSPQALAAQLAEHAINVWSGHYYALELVERLGFADDGGMVRVGLAHYNTRAEIDRLIEALT